MSPERPPPIHRGTHGSCRRFHRPPPYPFCAAGFLFTDFSTGSSRGHRAAPVECCQEERHPKRKGGDKQALHTTSWVGLDISHSPRVTSFKASERPKLDSVGPAQPDLSLFGASGPSPGATGHVQVQCIHKHMCIQPSFHLYIVRTMRKPGKMNPF